MHVVCLASSVNVIKERVQDITTTEICSNVHRRSFITITIVISFKVIDLLLTTTKTYANIV